jgi:hypothetical protein
VRHFLIEDERAIAFDGCGLIFGQVAAVRAGAIDKLDAEAIERSEQGVDAVGALDFIRQIAADLFVGQVALGFGLGNERLQIMIDDTRHVWLLPHIMCGWSEVGETAGGSAPDHAPCSSVGK